MIKLALAILLFIAAQPSFAEESSRLIGVWKLRSFQTEFQDGEPPRATLGERFAAHFIDSAVSCGGMILGTHIGTSLGVGAAPAVLMFVGYMLFSDALGEGQSFGKKLVKIAVVDQSTGAPCTYGGSLLRNLVRMLGVFDWAFALG